MSEVPDTTSEPQEPTEQPTPTEPTNPPTDPEEEQPEVEAEIDEITKLQSEMEKYQRAYREEMEQAAKLANDKQETFASALEYFQRNVPLAAAQIIHLLQFSQSDSTRLGASKYVIECVRRGVVDDISDPVTAILQELKNNPGPKELAPKLSN